MELIEFSWLHDWPTFKEAIQKTLGSSGQQIKRYYSSKEQDRPVKAKEIKKLPLDLVNHLRINPIYQGPEIKILAETEDYIAIHKPAGLHCHPLVYSDKNTLLNYFASKGKWAPLLVNESNYDRGLLFRLDNETSGVMILAKNESFFKHIREHFNTSMKRKFYWAIVEGDFNREGQWTHYFRSTGQKGLKQKVTEEAIPDSQTGSLSVLKVASQNDKSLLLVNLKTGLRHQIRAQLSHLGFPILGDELYGGKQADRLFLHAFRYEFFDTIEDAEADLFNVFFNLNSALQMSHDVLGRF